MRYLIHQSYSPVSGHSLDGVSRMAATRLRPCSESRLSRACLWGAHFHKRNLRSYPGPPCLQDRQRKLEIAQRRCRHAQSAGRKRCLCDQSRWQGSLSRQDPQTNQSQRFEIDVSDAETIELITEDAGDGNGGDWGFWFGVELRR